MAQRHSQLAKDLFNASFVSCWTELEAAQQDELMAALQQALVVRDLPEISQTVLNLAEFMEHCERGPLPIETALLGEQAVRCRAYAKALHYKEKEFFKKPTVPVIEALISINNKLGQKEAATGLLEWGRKNLPDLKVQERYYEKLHDWEKALKIYVEKSAEKPDDAEIALGRMRCLEKLGEWGDLHSVAEAQWQVGFESDDRYIDMSDGFHGRITLFLIITSSSSSPLQVADDATKNKMARMAASASWGRHEWSAMARYVQR